MTEKERINLFENGSIDPASFHHADHVRLAFSYLRLYPPLQSLERFSAALKRFAHSNGKPNLYNETITCAYFFLINERIARSEDESSWEAFARANPELLTWKNGILHRYYSEATLNSALAKRIFILPDKLISVPQ